MYYKGMGRGRSFYASVFSNRKIRITNMLLLIVFLIVGIVFSSQSILGYTSDVSIAGATITGDGISGITKVDSYGAQINSDLMSGYTYFPGDVLINESVVLFCGDATCNNGETCGSCSQDCGACPVFLPPAKGGGGGGGGAMPSSEIFCRSDYRCEDWQACTKDNLQIRICVDISNCNETITENRACTYGSIVDISNNIIGEISNNSSPKINKTSQNNISDNSNEKQLSSQKLKEPTRVSYNFSISSLYPILIVSLIVAALIGFISLIVIAKKKGVFNHMDATLKTSEQREYMKKIYLAILSFNNKLKNNPSDTQSREQLKRLHDMYTLVKVYYEKLSPENKAKIGKQVEDVSSVAGFLKKHDDFLDIKENINGNTNKENLNNNTNEDINEKGETKK